MKCLIVSSLELARYDNWSPACHFLLQTSRDRSPDREEAFWRYMEEIKKLKRSDLYRIFREAADEQAAVDEVERILLPGKHVTKLTESDREALRDTIRQIMTTYTTKLEAEIAAEQASLQALKGKFK